MKWPDIVILSSILIGAILSAYYGKKIKMGEYWIFFFTATLTFVIGFFIVLVSDRIKPNQTVKTLPGKWYLGILSTIFILIGLFYAWAIWNFIEYDIEAKATMVYPYETNYWLPFRYLMFGAGFCGAGVYVGSKRIIVDKEENAINTI